jgi:hypothetical protein
MRASFQDAWTDASVAWNAKRTAKGPALGAPFRILRHLGAHASRLVEPTARWHAGARTCHFR